jgi:hypothetical protein
VSGGGEDEAVGPDGAAASGDGLGAMPADLPTDTMMGGDDDYGHLFGETVHRRVEDAAVRVAEEDDEEEPAVPAPPPPPEPPAPAPQPAPVPEPPADAGGGLIAGVPQSLAPIAAPAASPADLPAPGTGEGDVPAPGPASKICTRVPVLTSKVLSLTFNGEGKSAL